MPIYIVGITRVVQDYLTGTVAIDAPTSAQAEQIALANAEHVHLAFNHQLDADEYGIEAAFLAPEGTVADYSAADMHGRARYHLQLDRWLDVSTGRQGTLIRVTLTDAATRTRLGTWDDDEGALTALLTAAAELAGDRASGDPAIHMQELVQAALAELGMPCEPDSFTFDVTGS